MIRQAKFVLGISGTCSKEEVLKAFRRLALIFHPDKNGDSEESKKKFQIIQQSKLTLLSHLGEAGDPPASAGDATTSTSTTAGSYSHCQNAQQATKSSASSGPWEKKPETEARSGPQKAMWACSACEVKERGAHPPNNVSSTCTNIGSLSTCFCGHLFAGHHFQDDHFECTSCSCSSFTYQAPDSTCVCGCSPKEHGVKYPYPCKRCQGTCQQFYSTQVCPKCNCDWACHRVVAESDLLFQAGKGKCDEPVRPSSAPYRSYKSSKNYPRTVYETFAENTFRNEEMKFSKCNTSVHTSSGVSTSWTRTRWEGIKQQPRPAAAQEAQEKHKEENARTSSKESEKSASTASTYTHKNASQTPTQQSQKCAPSTTPTATPTAPPTSSFKATWFPFNPRYHRPKSAPPKRTTTTSTTKDETSSSPSAKQENDYPELFNKYQRDRKAVHKIRRAGRWMQRPHSAMGGNRDNTMNVSTSAKKGQYGYRSNNYSDQGQGSSAAAPYQDYASSGSTKPMKRPQSATGRLGREKSRNQSQNQHLHMQGNSCTTNTTAHTTAWGSSMDVRMEYCPNTATNATRPKQRPKSAVYVKFKDRKNAQAAGDRSVRSAKLLKVMNATYSTAVGQSGTGKKPKMRPQSAKVERKSTQGNRDGAYTYREKTTTIKENDDNNDDNDNDDNDDIENNSSDGERKEYWPPQRHYASSGPSSFVATTQRERPKSAFVIKGGSGDKKKEREADDHEVCGKNIKEKGSDADDLERAPSASTSTGDSSPEQSGATTPKCATTSSSTCGTQTLFTHQPLSSPRRRPQSATPACGRRPQSTQQEQPSSTYQQQQQHPFSHLVEEAKKDLLAGRVVHRPRATSFLTRNVREAATAWATAPTWENKISSRPGTPTRETHARPHSAVDYRRRKSSQFMETPPYMGPKFGRQLSRGWVRKEPTPVFSKKGHTRDRDRGEPQTQTRDKREKYEEISKNRDSKVCSSTVTIQEDLGSEESDNAEPYYCGANSEDETLEFKNGPTNVYPSMYVGGPRAKNRVLGTVQSDMAVF